MRAVVNMMPIAMAVAARASCSNTGIVVCRVWRVPEPLLVLHRDRLNRRLWFRRVGEVTGSSAVPISLGRRGV